MWANEWDFESSTCSFMFSLRGREIQTLSILIISTVRLSLFTYFLNRTQHLSTLLLQPVIKARKCERFQAIISYISPTSPVGQPQRNALPTSLQSPPFWQGFGMQDVSSISQRPPVNPTLQVHIKPVEEIFYV